MLNLLADAGVVVSDPDGIRVFEQVEASEAVRRAVEASDERERIERSRLEMMRAYAETTDCRRAFLLGYFGERLAAPCRYCDVCKGLEERGELESAAEHQSAGAVKNDPYSPPADVEHHEWGPGVVMRAEEDRITVFFEQEGYKVLSRRVLEEKHLLDAE